MLTQVLKMIKTAFTAVFVVFALTAATNAVELNTVKKKDVQQLTADLQLPAPELAVSEALLPKDGLDPVVITVPGLKFGEIGWGPFELKNFIRIFRKLFPDNDLDEADIVNGFVAFDKSYFFTDDEETVADLAAQTPQRAMPDNYLELKLKEIPGYENHDIKIAPFTWSRDPGETEQAVPELAKTIAATYDAYKNTGRPLYILAHSWGSILTHEALHRLETSRPDIKIDKLITADSPLVPANFVVKIFLKVETDKEHLLKAVTKPASVKDWHNIWAKRDAYSNAIPAADTNYQTDAAVENVEPTLIDLILHNKLLKKEARHDLFKIRDIKAWHASYFYDFKASLLSIHKEIFIPIFRPILAPQVMDCAKTPVPMCKP